VITKLYHSHSFDGWLAATADLDDNGSEPDVVVVKGCFQRNACNTSVDQSERQCVRNFQILKINFAFCRYCFEFYYRATLL